MDTGFLNKVTLEYMSNRYLNNKSKNSNLLDIIDNNDLEFYKKRIINTTRELIKCRLDLSYNSAYRESKYGILYANFLEYLNLTIEMFKLEDKKDIIQESIGYNNIGYHNTENLENLENSIDLLTDTINDNTNDNINDSIIYKKNVKYNWEKFGNMKINNTKNEVSIIVDFIFIHSYLNVILK